jgi:hypothetical protein
MADDRVDVVFGAEFSDLVAAVQQVKDQLASLTAPVRGIGDDFKLAGASMTDGAKSGSDAWAQAFSLINASVDTVLKGVLLGTQTWQQAMGKVFADLAASFAETVAMMMLKWIEAEAIFGAGSSAGGGLLGVVGGLFGGAAAGGGVAGDAADAGTLAMFQAGAWSIPRDMIAVVHAGEMILPADVAATARGGGTVPGFPGGQAAAPGGTGFNLNVSVQALDAAGVAQWANANAKTLATTIAKYMGNNPSASGQ